MHASSYLIQQVTGGGINEGTSFCPECQPVVKQPIPCDFVSKLIADGSEFAASTVPSSSSSLRILCDSELVAVNPIFSVQMVIFFHLIFSLTQVSIAILLF